MMLRVLIIVMLGKLLLVKVVILTLIFFLLNCDNPVDNYNSISTHIELANFATLAIILRTTDN